MRLPCYTLNVITKVQKKRNQGAEEEKPKGFRKKQRAIVGRAMQQIES